MEVVMRVVSEEPTNGTADETNDVVEPDDREHGEHCRIDQFADMDDGTPEEEGYGYGV
jgi:hypothetical protein